ncbi:MAG: glucose-6-phosphate isomerase [Alphaproteobacteria bacterium]|nr:glucose-6-phosphate isomerase [Alphaproteobacteria bacterium]
MSYSHEVESCFSDAIGADGLARADFAALLEAARPAVDALRRRHGDGSLPLLRLPARRDDLAGLTEVAERYRRDFDDILVLGTGGSSLGGKSLCELAGPAPTTPPRLHFLENVDPHSFDALIAAIDPARTGVIVISKSGGTAETLTQLYGCLNWLAAARGRDALQRHVTAIVEPGKSVLRRLAESLQMPALDHDPNVGGRYSVLSLVGLLPALIMGLDAAAVRDGAASVLDPLLGERDMNSITPAVGAAVSIGLARHRGASMSVIFPYIDRLASFGLWYRQLWAESIGKDGKGTTPLRAMGTVDQHSQLQLYLDGPKDKMYTIVMGAPAGRGPVIDTALFDDPALSPLRGRRMGDLLDACQRATAETLVAKGRPVRIMRLTKVDERAMGALMMHFMLETIIAAHLLGVDPFDQPAVEQGKVLARRYMEERSGEERGGGAR